MNSLMTTLSPTATAMIRKDHAMVLGQFRKLEPDTSPQTREATIRTICAALEIHAQVEEELFYPAMREAGVDSPVLAKSKPEHDRMRELMQPLTSNQLEGQPAEQIRALDELMNTVMHHMADEETQLLPAAERQCSKQELSELGARMTQRKMALARPRAGELAVDMARAAPTKSTVVAVAALVTMAWLLGHRRHHRHWA
jgi:iron-sulfur cluster repair protein YtfE (RIC family)